MHIRRKLLFEFDMQSGMMTHVNKISFARTNALCCLQCLGNTLMRRMRLDTQGIHNQNIQVLQLFIGLFRHGQHICNISQTFTYTIPQNRQTPVHHLKRNNLRMIDKEVLSRLHFLQENLRYTGIFMFQKTIGHSRTQVSCRIVIGIYGNLAETAKRTKIIQSSYMVIVLMSNQHSIYFFK